MHNYLTIIDGKKKYGMATLVLFCIVTIVSCSTQGNNMKRDGQQLMPSDRQPDTDIAFGLTDAECYIDPKKSDDQVVFEMVRNGYMGLVADGTKAVNLKEHATLPYVVAIQRSFDDIDRSPTDKNAIVVAHNLLSGQMYTGFLVEGAVEGGDFDDPDEAGEPQEGSLTHIYHYDLFLTAGIPKVPGIYHITSYLGNTQSTSIVTTIVNDTLSSAEAITTEVEKLLLKLPPKQVVIPNDGMYPKFDKQVGSPEIPVETGIAITFTKPDSLNTSGALYLSFNLPVYAHEIVDTVPEVQAVIPLYLMITAHKSGFRGAIPINAPVLTSINLDSSRVQNVIGYVSLDVNTNINFGAEPEDLTVRVVSRQYATDAIELSYSPDRNRL